MFKVQRYENTDAAQVLAFMQAHPFAIVTAIAQDGYPVATHIPVEVAQQEDGTIVITGHIARKTDHAQALEHNPNALVVFTGPHAYISASWYTDTRRAGTWNYMTVHAKGQLQLLDEDATFDIINKLTERYEAASETAATMDKMDETYIRNSLKGIVAFSMVVTQLENVFKLSQNKDDVSYQSIITQLRLQGGDDATGIATAMEQLRPAINS